MTSIEMIALQLTNLSNTSLQELVAKLYNMSPACARELEFDLAMFDEDARRNGEAC